MTGLFLEENRFSIVNNKKSSEDEFTAFIFNKIQKDYPILFRTKIS
jgi:hypothetical protein